MIWVYDTSIEDPVDTGLSEILYRNKAVKGDWILFSISKHAPQFLLHWLRLTPSAKIPEFAVRRGILQLQSRDRCSAYGQNWGWSLAWHCRISTPAIETCGWSVKQEIWIPILSHQYLDLQDCTSSKLLAKTHQVRKPPQSSPPTFRDIWKYSLTWSTRTPRDHEDPFDLVKGWTLLTERLRVNAIFEVPNTAENVSTWIALVYLWRGLEMIHQQHW